MPVLTNRSEIKRSQDHDEKVTTFQQAAFALGAIQHRRVRRQPGECHDCGSVGRRPCRAGAPRLPQFMGTLPPRNRAERIICVDAAAPRRRASVRTVVASRGAYELPRPPRPRGNTSGRTSTTSPACVSIKMSDRPRKRNSSSSGSAGSCVSNDGGIVARGRPGG